MSRFALAPVLRTILARLREFFLLKEAERRISKLSESQRQLTRFYHGAAAKRLLVTRLLHTADLTAVSLSLYRESVLMLARAFLASATDVDIGTLDRQALIDATESALKNRNLSIPNLALIKPTLLASDPMAMDRLEPRSAARMRQDFEATARWLTTLIDLWFPRQFMRARIGRIVLTLATVGFCFRGWQSTSLCPKTSR
jgi:hypothetical protein